jgi:uncharacterized protein
MTAQDKKTIEIALKAYKNEGEVLSPSIVWHVPGKNPVSGDYKGTKAYLEGMVAKMTPIDEWVVDVENVMANGPLAVVAVRVKGLRKGHRVDLEGAHVLRIENDKVVEGWGFYENQEILDTFFSA